MSPTLFKSTKIVPKDNIEMVNIDIKKEENKCHECSQILAIIFSTVGIIIWEVYAIISLVNNSNTDIQNICPESNIWAALLSIVIVTGINMLIRTRKNTKSNNDKNNKGEAISSCLGLALFIWLCVELFNTCALNNLHENSVYVLSNIYFWIFTGIILIALLIVFVMICLSCCSSCCRKKKPDKQDPLDLI